MKSFLNRLFAPASASALTDFALLVLRAGLGIVMFAAHGLDKLSNYGEKAEGFPAVLGMSPAFALALAAFAEGICSLLLALGLVSRFAALMLSVTMAVAFGIAHKFALTGPSSGEMAFIYLAGFVTVLIAGPGRFSIDAVLFRKKG